MLSSGSVRHVGRRGAGHVMKDDGSLNPNEGKPSKRGVAGGHEVRFCIQASVCLVLHDHFFLKIYFL